MDRSGRIDEQNRLVYRITNDFIELLSCKGHYE
ncbi:MULTISPECIES: type II toxin-antitoxin system YoeB family toxin [Selenomonas]|nr:type II toxin-antitoxin system YoeB family toxin [Selenomonas sp.]